MQPPQCHHLGWEGPWVPDPTEGAWEGLSTQCWSQPDLSAAWVQLLSCCVTEGIGASRHRLQNGLATALPLKEDSLGDLGDCVQDGAQQAGGANALAALVGTGISTVVITAGVGPLQLQPRGFLSRAGCVQGGASSTHSQENQKTEQRFSFLKFKATPRKLSHVLKSWGFLLM